MLLQARDLSHFLEIVRTGQLGRAAATAGLSSPALSKVVRRLESEVGLPLFERSGRGMVLTRFGQVFAEHAAQVVEQIETVMRIAGEIRAGRAGVLRIGATVAMLESRIAPALAALQPRRPGLRAQVSIGESGSIIEALRSGQLDLAVVPVYEDDLTGFVESKLSSDDFVAVVRRGHPLLDIHDMGIADLAKWPCILPVAKSPARKRIDAAFEAAGLALLVATIEIDVNSAWTIGIVRSTDMISFVPEEALVNVAPNEIERLNLSALNISRNISLLRRSSAPLSPLAEEWAKLLQSMDNGVRRGTRSGP